MQKKGPLNPGKYPPNPHTWESERIYEAKQHFLLLQRRLQRADYLAQVALYEKALCDFFALPPCWRVDKGLPLSPSSSPGLLQYADVPTPKTGGRPASSVIQERNARIEELKQEGRSHNEICRILDAENFPLPHPWKGG